MIPASAAWRLLEPPRAAISLDAFEIGPLVEAAHIEGFQFLDRLIADWRSGANRFDRDGERFMCVCGGTRIVATGGLNHDPFAGPRTGRLRRLYVVPEQRRQGVGRALVQSLLSEAPLAFDRVRLRTDDAGAAAFYERLGFSRCFEPRASHSYDLVRGGSA